MKLARIAAVGLLATSAYAAPVPESPRAPQQTDLGAPVDSSTLRGWTSRVRCEDGMEGDGFSNSFADASFTGDYAIGPAGLEIVESEVTANFNRESFLYTDRGRQTFTRGSANDPVLTVTLRAIDPERQVFDDVSFQTDNMHYQRRPENISIFVPDGAGGILFQSDQKPANDRGDPSTFHIKTDGFDRLSEVVVVLSDTDKLVTYDFGTLATMEGDAAKFLHSKTAAYFAIGADVAALRRAGCRVNPV